MLDKFLFVGLGGAFGAMMRYGIYHLFAHIKISSYWATFSVNIIGSFFIGWLIQYFSGIENNTYRLIIVTGVLGGFTTFSTFSADALIMLKSNHISTSIVYMLATNVLCLTAAAIGYLIKY